MILGFLGVLGIFGGLVNRNEIVTAITKLRDCSNSSNRSLDVGTFWECG